MSHAVSKILLNREMWALIVKLLLSMCPKQKLQIKWDNCISFKSDVTYTVRQEGILVVIPLLITLFFISYS